MIKCRTILLLAITVVGFVIANYYVFEAKASTLVQKPTKTAKIQTINTVWTEHTKKIYKTLLDANFNGIGAKILINECKKNTKDPMDCIKVGASIANAESSGFIHCSHNNCLGIAAGTIPYKTLQIGVNDWVRRYKKNWHHLLPKDFYGTNNKTWYCTQFHHGIEIPGCPDGLKNAQKVYNLLLK